MSFDESLTYLYSIAPPFHEVGAAAYKPGLDTMRRLMSALNTQSSTRSHQHAVTYTQYPVIHVAGTNGKGSTSHLIASALAAAGLRVGLYTSPHLVSFCERVRVIEPMANGQKPKAKPRLIPEAYVADFVGRHQALFEQLQPSFFEITTAMAFCWLAEQQVDIAVIEVGLGGLLDATNIVTPVLSVITNIGLDARGDCHSESRHHQTRRAVRHRRVAPRDHTGVPFQSSGMRHPRRGTGDHRLPFMVRGSV